MNIERLLDRLAIVEGGGQRWYQTYSHFLFARNESAPEWCFVGSQETVGDFLPNGDAFCR